ncbi:hypothetical protein [Tsukamurella pulmonis]|uniref:hypothetical protein n=1 Tax=Tsukamurella pulmonis TaxID=47312 RepID=UPI001058D2E6|nr:hypothetical protein [Tsukamurella pulmonis]
MTRKRPTKRMKDPWIVHPNRFAEPTILRPIGEASDEPPPLITEVDYPDMTSACIVVLPLTARYRRRRDVDGDVVFDDDNWASVLGSSSMLARFSGNTSVRPFRIRFDKKHFDWWDDVTTDFDRLENPNIAEEIKAWLELTYPDATGPIRVIDQRPGVG